MSVSSAENFQTGCRHWRRLRNLSQLDLALAANVSQRHVSWLETGRSRPSREMVVRLAEAMDLPLRERNVLLNAAGFAPAYRESQLDEPFMAPVLAALNQVLDHHEPFPALVVDRCWDVQRRNAAADLLLGALGGGVAGTSPGSADATVNLAELTLHPQGLRRYITNWSQAAAGFVGRLRGEIRASGDPAVRERLTSYIELAGDYGAEQSDIDYLLPVLPLEFQVGDLVLSLFSVIATFGTPQDITTDELRIETFYASDDKTREFFTAAAAAVTPATR